MGEGYHSLSYNISRLHQFISDENLFYKVIGKGVIDGSVDYPHIKTGGKVDRHRLGSVINISDKLQSLSASESAPSLTDIIYTDNTAYEELLKKEPEIPEGKKKPRSPFSDLPILAQIIFNYLKNQNGIFVDKKLLTLGQDIYGALHTPTVLPFYDPQEEAVVANLVVQGERAPSLSSLGQYHMTLLRKETTAIIETLKTHDKKVR